MSLFVRVSAPGSSGTHRIAHVRELDAWRDMHPHAVIELVTERGDVSAEPLEIVSVLRDDDGGDE